MRSTITTVYAVVFCVLVGACASTRPTVQAPCITPKTSDLIISWGTEDDSTRQRNGYMMNTYGEMYSITGTIGTSISDTLYLGYINPSLYCTTATEVRDAFLKTQALNVRGTRGRYMMYANPKSDVYLRAVWNPDLETFQSREMRLQYNALMQLLPQKSE